MDEVKPPAKKTPQINKIFIFGFLALAILAFLGFIAIGMYAVLSYKKGQCINNVSPCGSPSASDITPTAEQSDNSANTTNTPTVSTTTDESQPGVNLTVIQPQITTDNGISTYKSMRYDVTFKYNADFGVSKTESNDLCGYISDTISFENSPLEILLKPCGLGWSGVEGVETYNIQSKDNKKFTVTVERLVDEKDSYVVYAATDTESENTITIMAFGIPKADVEKTKTQIGSIVTSLEYTF